MLDTAVRPEKTKRTQKSILVVDDEPQILRAIEDTLEDEFQVYVHTSPEVAIQMISELPQLAVIMSDQRMPAMPGHRFLTRAEELSDATRLLLTGYADLEAVINAVNEGHIFGYISKPWSPELLRLSIHKAVERHELIRELSQEREMMQNLMANVPDFIYFKDRDLRYTRVNRALQERSVLAGAGSVLGKRLSETTLLPKDVAEMLDRREAASIRTGEIDRDIEYETRTHNGRMTFFSRTVAPIKDEKGEVTGLVGVSRDITDSKRREREIRLLLDVTRAESAATSMESALESVLRRICEDTGWSFAEAWMPDPAGNLLICTDAWFGDPNRFSELHEFGKANPFRAGEGMVGRAWVSKVPEWITEMSAARESERSEAASRAGIGAALVVPILRNDGGFIGALFFGYGASGESDERLIEIILGVSAQLGQIFERRAANEASSRRALQQAIVAELGGAALAETRTDSIMQRTLETVARTLHVELGSVLETVPSGNGFVLRSGFGWEDGTVGAKIQGPEGTLAAFLVNLDAPLTIGNMSAETRFEPPARLLGHGVISGAFVPIRDDQMSFGVLAVFTRKSRIFDIDDLNFLAAVSNILTTFLRRQSVQQALQNSERFARSTIDALSDQLCVIDDQGRIVTVNRAWREYAAQEGLSFFGAGESSSFLEACDRAAAAGFAEAERLAVGIRSVIDGAVQEFEFEFRMQPLADQRWFLARASRFGTGGPLRVVMTFDDISARKTQEYKIARLSRIRRVLSNINATIVRVRDRDELFREVCRISVEFGQFSMVSVGMLREDGETADIVAVHGKDAAWAQGMRFSTREDLPEGQTASGQAMRTGQPVTCNDLTKPGRPNPLWQEMVNRGYRALMILPIFVAGRLAGIFGFASDQANVFDSEETALLQEMAGDIGFAMDYMEKESRVNFLALYDALTGLANRTLFVDRVTHYIGEAAAESAKVAVLIINLDRFRVVNDTMGQAAGDSLLQIIGNRMKECMPIAADVARLSADTFAAVVMHGAAELDIAHLVEHTLLEALYKPITVAGQELRIASKCGIAFYPSDGAAVDELLRNAGLALQRAKATGENFLFYSPEMNVRVGGILSLESRLRQAVEEEQFVLYYQPKIEVRNRKIIGFEALIRWNEPGKGLVAPGMFIPLLEETGMILDVGRWALQQAASDYLKMLDLGLAPPRIAVNVSQVQLRQKRFVADVRNAIERGGKGRALIDLEITESMIMEDIDLNIAKLREITDSGIGIALDDFGTGYSSLSYIAKLPVNTLKVDRSFVITMPTDPDNMAIVSTVISLAHSLNLKVIAEGVDSEEQARLLRLLKCDEAQGYLFGKPMPLETIEEILREQADGTKSE